MMSKLTGIAASSGIAIAKAYRLENPELVIQKKEITSVQEEEQRFTQALQRAKQELEAIKQHAGTALGEDKAAIFAAHLLVLNDPELINPVIDKIKTERVNSEFALQETANIFITMFEQMDNEYMKERAADIRDVTKRVLARLLGVEYANPSTITEQVIIIADDLTPSDTAQLNKQYVLGFTTDIGGRTSHSAIMARSMEIPAVVGTKAAMSQIASGTVVIVDGLEGEVVIDPDQETISAYQLKKDQYEKQRKEWAKLAFEPTVTGDGQHVELAANIGTPDDLAAVLRNGAEGIGLYRTEFLYMGRNELPTEEEQFTAYKTVLEKMENKPVVVRTLDIGGDKELPYLQLPHELNPFLGFRAIRLCLEEQNIFRTQLRALLRASVFGNLKIMFPMIATLDEFRQAKQVLQEEKEALIQAEVSVSSAIEVGMMVEIPSTAILADQFAKEADFLSIGTNDLIQYTFAADRMNEKVSYLYQPYHPSILRLIQLVINGAHKNGKWVGMCGEMAGDERAIPLLLGLGLDEFSMSATSILPARSQIKTLHAAQTKEIAEQALQQATTDEVLALLK